MTEYKTTEVFTPSSVATVSFVERDRLNSRLVNALLTPGKQVVVFGRSGAGKTTLLENKLRQLYSSHIVSRCTASSTVNDLMLDGFDQLDGFSIAKKEVETKTSGKIGWRSPGVEVGVGRDTAEATSEERVVKALPSARRLAALLHERGACWVLEDFHKVQIDEKRKLSQLMKVFMDLGTEFPSVRIVALGAVRTAREIVSLDREMQNRVAEIEVPLMSPEETRLIVEKGSSLLNVEIPSEIIDKIVEGSNGLAAVAHQLCLNMCLEAGVVSTCARTELIDRSLFEAAVQQWIEDSADTLQKEYDSAVQAQRTRRFDNYRVILHSLADFGLDGATSPQLFDSIRKVYPEYPAGNLTAYLRRLMNDPARGHLIVMDEASKRISFASSMFHAYVKARSGDRPVAADASTAMDWSAVIHSSTLDLFVHGVSSVFAQRGEQFKVYSFPSTAFWIEDAHDTRPPDTRDEDSETE